MTRPPKYGEAPPPWRQVGEVAAQVVSDLHFRRRIERLHALGPRATAEFLAELGVERSIMTIIDQKLERYSELDPEALEATGGDQFWAAPLRVVNRLVGGDGKHDLLGMQQNQDDNHHPAHAQGDEIKP